MAGVLVGVAVAVFVVKVCDYSGAVGGEIWPVEVVRLLRLCSTLLIISDGYPQHANEEHRMDSTCMDAFPGWYGAW